MNGLVEVLERQEKQERLEEARDDRLVQRMNE